MGCMGVTVDYLLVTVRWMLGLGEFCFSCSPLLPPTSMHFIHMISHLCHTQYVFQHFLHTYKLTYTSLLISPSPHLHALYSHDIPSLSHTICVPTFPTMHTNLLIQTSSSLLPATSMHFPHMTSHLCHAQYALTHFLQSIQSHFQTITKHLVL